MHASVQCLLWDFGDTLCDERFIWNSGPRWREVYDTFEDGPGMDWCLGRADMQGFARFLSERMPLSPAEALLHMQERCDHIAWFPYAWSVFKQHQVPQAIVTVNPDLFSTDIVPRHRLDEYAETIVTSWEEQSVDKGALCEIALERMGYTGPRNAALLIDNRRDCIDAWVGRGGRGYHFRDDAIFKRDMLDGLDALPDAIDARGSEAPGSEAP